jgi:hypothetical protein
MPNTAWRHGRNLDTKPPGIASSNTLKQTYGASELLRIRHLPEVRSAAGDRCRTRCGQMRPQRFRLIFLSYGVVVLSVNVSVLLYVPVRSASAAPIDWRRPTVTASLVTGPL